MDWKTEIGCEGGPILVANHSDFLQWTGTTPFASTQHTHLLYYSAFSSELPATFSKHGTTGHIYIKSESPAIARDKLMATCIELFPGSEVDTSNQSWVLTRPDGRKLHASLQPSNEYDASIKDLDEDRNYSYGEESSCYLWSAQPGVVLIEISRDNTQLLLAQVYFADSDSDAEKGYEFARTSDIAKPTGTSYKIDKGAVMAIWSPQAASDLSTSFNLDSIGTNKPGVELDLLTESSGAAFWMQSGIYSARVGHHQTENWGMSWCVLSVDA